MFLAYICCIAKRQLKMVKAIKYFLLLFICFWHYCSFGQQKNIDSLLTISKTAVDTQKIDALNDLGWEYKTIDVNLSFRYSQEALHLAEKLNLKKRVAKSLNCIGAVYEIQQKHKEAKEHFESALKIQEELGNKGEIASMRINIGIIYAEEGDIPTSRKYMQEALTLLENLGNKGKIANVLMNIGGTYNSENNYPFAIDYYKQSLKISEEIKDLQAIAKSSNDLAFSYYITSDYKNANIYLSKSIEFATKIKSGDILQSDYEILSAVYANKKQFELAYNYHIVFTKIKDSLTNNESAKQVQALQAKYETEKKQKEIEQLNKEKETQSILTGEDNKRKNIVIVSVILGLILTFVFSIFLFNRFKITKKQKLIIEEKQKEILDSIHYAKRIQGSLLPTEKYIEKSIKRLNKKE
jgi:tetratricopeptide (TPR) repeat protein